VLVLPAAAETDQKLLGDESDGSRAPSTHVIELIPWDVHPDTGEFIKGERIDPDIDPSEKVVLPFSTRLTCGGLCHSYNIISKGWHFNAGEPNVPCGRLGQPWIYFDSRTGTQILISYRPLPGTFKPGQIGLTDREFTLIFGRHMPGGGVAERKTEDPNEILRQYISGKLEINCLSCHNADPGQDQGSVSGYAVQVARGNFRWAPAASSGFASVSGSAQDMPETYDPFDPFMSNIPRRMQRVRPTITYSKTAFDHDKKVAFNIVRQVPAHRCYYCHSNLYLETENTEKWSADEDIHLTAGMTCVDCHRNGVDHNIIRGYEQESAVSENPLAATSSCRGCHLGEESSSSPVEGRLGAPVPEHKGIPPIHFEKLTCTACHSGPWPGQKTYLAKTSRAHRLGTPNVNKSPVALPHIVSPVFAKQRGIIVAYLGRALVLEGGKIAPHKLIWPAFWGTLKDRSVTPVDLEDVQQTVGEVFAQIQLPSSGDWPSLTKEHIAEALASLQKTVEGKAVYICGGKLYSLDDSGKLCEQEGHQAAQPYLWPIAHDVRPAAQSLGVRRCEDCHSIDAPFFFGEVAIDSPVVAERDSVKKMVEFERLRPFYTKAFAFSFIFRPWLKVFALGSCAVLAVVLLLYALRALACIVKVLAEKD